MINQQNTCGDATVILLLEFTCQSFFVSWSLGEMDTRDVSGPRDYLTSHKDYAQTIHVYPSWCSRLHLKEIEESRPAAR